MSEDIIVAIISATAVIAAAVIAGVFSLKKRDGKPDRGTSIQQTQKGDNNTQIGVQNNTTIQVGETSLSSGTIIIDGGDATGGGKIEYKSEE